MILLSRINLIRSLALCTLSVLLLIGCDTLGYYSQGIKGHLSLVSQVQPIEAVIDNKKTPEKTRKQLKIAVKARQFAIDTLKLPNNQSYKGYADLKRKHVTWNVIATKELSMEPFKSCFPVTGCLSYRGYFSEAKAKHFAQQLQQKNYETFIGGSSAYSTLGWFQDPIVSPMLRHGDIRLVETLFHELAHQRLYIKDDSDFNEAFATAVGQNGTRQWLAKTNPEALSRYNKHLILTNQFLKLLNGSAGQLKKLYQSPFSDPLKRTKKKQLMAQLKTNYQRFKQQHKEDDRFDQWFEKPVNNPRLAMVAVYHQLVPDFERWLKACNNDYPRFYEVVERLSILPKEQRLEVLKKPASCTL